MIIQYIASIFIAFVVYRLFQNYRSKKLSGGTFVLWLIVWIAVLIIFWSPDIASYIALYVGIGRGADLIIYTAIVVLVYLVYRIFLRLEQIDHTLTKLIRSNAIIDAEQKEGQGSNPDTEL